MSAFTWKCLTLEENISIIYKDGVKGNSKVNNFNIISIATILSIFKVSDFILKQKVKLQPETCMSTM